MNKYVKDQIRLAMDDVIGAYANSVADGNTAGLNKISVQDIQEEIYQNVVTCRFTEDSVSVTPNSGKSNRFASKEQICTEIQELWQEDTDGDIETILPYLKGGE